MKPITIPIQFRRPLTSESGRGHDSSFPRFEQILLQTPSYTYLNYGTWQTDEASFKPEQLGKVLYTFSNGFPTPTAYGVVIQWRKVLLQVSMQSTRVYVNAASSNPDWNLLAIGCVRALLPICVVKPDRQAVAFQFWNNGPKGAVSTARILDVPRWEEVEANYSASTRKLLAEMMALDFKNKSSNDPKLLLWSGKPGGGKTYGIRALAWELRKYADFEYIVDPEVLFGDSSYFTNVLLRQRSTNDDDDDDDAPRYTDRWRVLIMEDTGELLAADAKARTGQGLSRLLNVMDGLIGQGLRLMILITTNEDLGALHPAVTRAGRCASNINFQSLTMDESNVWLAMHKCDRLVSKQHTLAELFAIAHDEELKTNWDKRPGAGFLAEVVNK